jgi:hypothetical protein
MNPGVSIHPSTVERQKEAMEDAYKVFAKTEVEKKRIYLIAE